MQHSRYQLIIATQVLSVGNTTCFVHMRKMHMQMFASRDLRGCVCFAALVVFALQPNCDIIASWLTTVVEC